MKLLVKNVFAALLIMVAIVPMSCTKSGSNSARQPLPDLSDFTITSATGFAAGTPATVSVYCTTLGSGTYKVFFDLAGANVAKAQSGTLVLANNIGTFKTPALQNAGATIMTLNSVTNSTGGGSAFPAGTKYILNDSTGLMTATIAGTNLFRATDVLATLQNDTDLTIRAVVAEPYATSMTIHYHRYHHANGIFDFSSYDVPEIVSMQYQMPTGGFVSASGTLQILSISPSLTGQFSFTGIDSTHVTSGQFSTNSPE